MVDSRLNLFQIISSRDAAKLLNTGDFLRNEVFLLQLLPEEILSEVSLKLLVLLGRIGQRGILEPTDQSIPEQDCLRVFVQEPLRQIELVQIIDVLFLLVLHCAVVVHSLHEVVGLVLGRGDERVRVSSIILTHLQQGSGQLREPEVVLSSELTHMLPILVGLVERTEQSQLRWL